MIEVIEDFKINILNESTTTIVRKTPNTIPLRQDKLIHRSSSNLTKNPFISFLASSSSSLPLRWSRTASEFSSGEPPPPSAHLSSMPLLLKGRPWRIWRSLDAAVTTRPLFIPLRNERSSHSVYSGQATSAASAATQYTHTLKIRTQREMEFGMKWMKAHDFGCHCSKQMRKYPNNVNS